jgi:hypothetical protein
MTNSTVLAIDKWSSKFQNILSKMPHGYWLFAADGTIHLMKLDGNGERIILPNGGASQDAIVETYICPNEIDGGDW